jgi:hypothetical protein
MSYDYNESERLHREAWEERMRIYRETEVARSDIKRQMEQGLSDMKGSMQYRADHEAMDERLHEISKDINKLSPQWKIVAGLIESIGVLAAIKILLPFLLL